MPRAGALCNTYHEGLPVSYVGFEAVLVVIQTVHSRRPYYAWAEQSETCAATQLQLFPVATMTRGLAAM